MKKEDHLSLENSSNDFDSLIKLFITPKERSEYAESLKIVFDMALFDTKQDVNQKQKNALFNVEQIRSVLLDM